MRKFLFELFFIFECKVVVIDYDLFWLQFCYVIEKVIFVFDADKFVRYELLFV